ncbi:MAG: response regulator [Deltaproteobacteria bacterium]|nr:response regulator [Deltaproteobacteria bacterium]
MAERSPVLVVDDELVFGEIMRQVFEGTEFEVDIYQSAEDALAEFAPGKWHAALLDKNLPGMSGLDLIEKLKAADPDIAAILMTGYASIDTAVSAMRLGAFDYLEKPFGNIALILEKLRRAVARRAIEIANRSLVAELREANVELEKKNEEITVARDELLRQGRMASMGQLASGVAHELNNPLAFVKSNVYIIEEYVEFFQKVIELAVPLKVALDEGPGAVEAAVRAIIGLPFFDELAFFSEDTRNAFKEVKDGLDRAVTIVRRMKDFTYLERTTEEKVDLRECVERAIQIVVGAESTKVKIDVVLVETTLARGFPRQLTQVFINLLLNALSAIEGRTGGEVRVKMHLGDGQVVVDVGDNGRGISPEHLDRVFEPFFTTDESGRGVGLGLNITREIVHRHGGMIRVRSELGGGSVFTVQLPIQN